MIGTATESCIGLLSELKKSNYIDLIGKKIVLIDKNKLKKIVKKSAFKADFFIELVLPN
jgi:CRP/FNR family transcriptional regulator, polysaccharide utilization system transcription regulator